jgi:hypothetical protein
MQMLLLYYPDDRLFAAESIQQVFESESGFRDVRFNEPGGALLEAIFVDDQDSTIVRLSRNRKTVSLSGQTGAALHAALIMQRHLQGPIRIIDLDYAFDLVLSDFKDIDELRTAIENAQAG